MPPRDGHGWSTLPTAAYADDSLSRSALRVLLVMGAMMDRHGRLWASQADLGMFAGVGRRQANKVLGELQRAGYVKVVGRQGHVFQYWVPTTPEVPSPMQALAARGKSRKCANGGAQTEDGLPSEKATSPPNCANGGAQFRANGGAQSSKELKTSPCSPPPDEGGDLNGRRPGARRLSVDLSSVVARLDGAPTARQGEPASSIAPEPAPLAASSRAPPVHDPPVASDGQPLVSVDRFSELTAILAKSGSE